MKLSNFRFIFLLVFEAIIFCCVRFREPQDQMHAWSKAQKWINLEFPTRKEKKQEGSKRGSKRSKKKKNLVNKQENPLNRLSQCRPSNLSYQHMLLYVFLFTSHCLIAISWWSIVTHLIYYFLSHFWRFIVDGFFMDPKCDLSCALV